MCVQLFGMHICRYSYTGVHILNTAWALGLYNYIYVYLCLQIGWKSLCIMSDFLLLIHFQKLQLVVQQGSELKS